MLPQVGEFLPMKPQTLGDSWPPESFLARNSGLESGESVEPNWITL